MGGSGLLLAPITGEDNADDEEAPDDEDDPADRDDPDSDEEGT
jgi:hypothetical protein